jgi:hypothetical protein
MFLVREVSLKAALLMSPARGLEEAVMASFTLIPVEKGILRCRHVGMFTPEDIQALTKFFQEYSGKLLIDLVVSQKEECARHIKQLRPMMPTAAIVGIDALAGVTDIPKSYYTHEVHVFKTETEALSWLREQ